MTTQEQTQINAEWLALHDGEPPLFLTRMGTTQQEVQAAYEEVALYMMGRAEEDQRENATKLFMFINATNGYVQLTWLNDDDEYASNWMYTLTLKGLWAASLEHEDGALYYDEMCIAAAMSFAEQTEALPSSISVWCRTELSPLFSVL